MAATPGLLDTDRLAALGLVLRALLCLEIRTVRLVDTQPLEEQPNHIMPGTMPVRALVHTTSGVEISVVIGVPEQVRRGCCVCSVGASHDVIGSWCSERCESQVVAGCMHMLCKMIALGRFGTLPWRDTFAHSTSCCLKEWPRDAPVLTICVMHALTAMVPNHSALCCG